MNWTVSARERACRAWWGAAMTVLASPTTRERVIVECMLSDIVYETGDFLR